MLLETARENTIATDQIVRYPAGADKSRYTFSLSAFPEATYAKTLADYFAFCKLCYQQAGYRANMLNVGYWIAQDRGSYSWTQQALGHRLKTFAEARMTYDPCGRLLSAYYRDMLGA